MIDIIDSSVEKSESDLLADAVVSEFYNVLTLELDSPLGECPGEGAGVSFLVLRPFEERDVVNHIKRFFSLRGYIVKEGFHALRLTCIETQQHSAVFFTLLYGYLKICIYPLSPTLN